LLLSLHHDQPESQSCFERFRTASVLGGLKALDSRVRRKGLETLDPSRGALIPIGMEIEQGRVVKNGYGVFHLAWQAERHPEWPDRIAREVEQIRAGIRQAHNSPLQFLIWVGMGGSAEDKSMYQAVGLLGRRFRTYILDSTDPEKLNSILDDMRRRGRLDDAQLLKRTLVVAMAMGMTSYEPVINLERIAALYHAARVDANPNIYCLTLPGSLLDTFSASQGYRRVPLQLDDANTTAGRHSAPLTRGSLYPLALAGIDLREWIAGANLTPEEIHTAFRLAAFLQVQAVAGRDKVTLLLPREWAGAGMWTKQNFEESLGKSEEFGIKIIAGERVRMTNYRSPRDPHQDRVFLAVQFKGKPAEKIAMLRRAGYPAAVLTTPASLSRYMQFIHYAVFGVAWLRKMNFVTQPGVELYKSIAHRVHAEAERAGSILKTKEWKRAEDAVRSSVWRGRITLRWDRLPASIEPVGTTAPVLYAELVKHFFGVRQDQRQCEYGELTFFGDMRYSARGRAVRSVLDRSAEALFRVVLKVPADVYEGPAMNHSYHEMIIGHGKCFSTILIADQDQAADYHRAQFLATQMALAERGRAVVSITLRDREDASLRALEEFFRQAATNIRARR
jgi:glucose-6-phosphate isomerase